MTVKVGCESAYYAGRASRDAEVEALQADLKHTEECCVGWATDYGNALKEVKALRADAERLDWMDKNGKSNVFSIVDKWYTRPDYGQPYTKHKTLREAIDAARKEKQDE